MEDPQARGPSGHAVCRGRLGAVVGEMPLANAEPGMLSSGEVSGDTNSGPTRSEFDPES
jgi:hypothetical protein